jgi:hypothetical protein
MKSKEEVEVMIQVAKKEIEELEAIRPDILDSISEGTCSPDEVDQLDQDIQVIKNQIGLYEWFLS